jgi:hypothetical protein
MGRLKKQVLETARILSINQRTLAVQYPRATEKGIVVRVKHNKLDEKEPRI